VADFNYKILKGALSGAANISAKGSAVFNLTYRQGKDNTVSVPCYISSTDTYLVEKVAKEYLIKENVGKSLVVVGSDYYESPEKIFLAVKKVHFIGNLVSQSELNQNKVDFSAD
jgi:hypothetical protein